MAAARFSQFGRRMMYNDPIRNEGLKGWPNRTEYKNVSLPAGSIRSSLGPQKDEA
jgi:hypothetical protein